MITTVLLDLDDTILDFHKAEKEALKKALQKVGVEPTEKLLARYSEINQAQWKKLELGELTQEEVKISRYRIFFEEYGITASPEETAKCYEQNLAYEHEKVDGAVPAIGDGGLCYAVLCNADKQKCVALWDDSSVEIGRAHV